MGSGIESLQDPICATKPMQEDGSLSEEFTDMHSVAHGGYMGNFARAFLSYDLGPKSPPAYCVFFGVMHFPPQIGSVFRTTRYCL